MVHACCVYKCSNRATKESTLHFHSFPSRTSGKDRFDAWVRAVNRQSESGNLWLPSPDGHYKICSDHFLQTDYKENTNIKILKKTAVPSVFPGHPFHLMKLKQHTRPQPRKRSLSPQPHDRETARKSDESKICSCWPASEASSKQDDTISPPITSVSPFSNCNSKTLMWNNLKMAPEDKKVKVLKQEYLRLYEKFQCVKELARIDLDLLSLSVDLENVPGAKTELDRVHELVHALMTEEIYPQMDHFDEELYEDDCQEVEMDDVNLIQNVETDNKKLNENSPLVKTENINLESEIVSSNTVVQGLDELLAQLTSVFAEQQMIDVFSRFREQTFNKVHGSLTTNQKDYGAPRTSEEDLPLTHTVQGSHSLELKETSHLDPILESVEGEGEITVADDIQGVSKEDKSEDNTHMMMDVAAISTNDTVMMNQPVALVSRKTSKQPKKIRSRPPDSQPISLQNLILTGVPNIEKIDDEKKESIATVMPTEKIYEGEQCGVTVEDRNLFNQHQKIHTEEDYTCTVCGKQFFQKNRLKRHTQLHSSEKPFLCNTCGKRFHTEGYLKKHIKCHGNNRPKLYCEVCGKPFAHRGSLNKHTSQHGKEKFKCSFCDKQYKNIDSLNAHKRRHKEHFPHQCSKCGQGFKDPVQLNVHERIHIGENPVFTCSICHKTFSSKVQLNVHKKSHPRYQCKMHNCSVCQEQFRGNQAMAQHMLTHSEDLQFCILCQQTFDSPLDLQSHLTSTHLMEKLFKCPICGDELSSGYKLGTHRSLYHPNANHFKCNDCGKSFSTKAALQIHRNGKHLKTKKYQCEYCGQNFYWESNFHRHVQNHQGLKPWKCSVCGKEFAQKASLKTHSWTHRADKRYSCESCGRGFNEKRALLSHRKTQHQDQQDSSEMNNLTVVPI